MNWWNSFVQWLSSSEESRIVSDAILPFLAIVVAGVLAALIARSMGKRLLDLHEREAKAAAVTSLITVARKASVWNTLGSDERAHTDHLADEANVRLRLLPDAGTDLAAAWVEHEFVAIKNYSATFSFQAEQSFADVRERLVEWQAKPARARKLFRADLDRWKAEDEGATPQPPAHALDDAVNSEAASTSGQPSWAVTTPTGSTPAPATSLPTAAPASSVSYDVTPADSTRITPATEASSSPADADSQTPEVVQAATTPKEDATMSVDPAPAVTADIEGASTNGAGGTPVDAGVVADANAVDTAADTPARRTTGMVSTPVVQPSRSVVPASPSDAADADAGDGTDSEAAYSAPVSAQQVRRRTSPDA